MQDDLVISLPHGASLRTLQVTATPDTYDEVLQRTVMILLTSDSPELLIDGKTPLQLITAATTGGVRGLNDMSGHYADVLRRMLNADETVVDRVDVEFSVDSGITISINISKPDSSEISGEFTL